MARKIKKKDLKKPDEFQTSFDKISRYILDNRSKFFIFLGVFVFLILSVSGWYFYRLNYEKNAQKIYSSAFDSYHKNSNTETYMNAIKLYKELVEKYPNSNVATNALYSMGNIYFNINEVDKSIDAYKEFIKKSRGCNELIALAYIGTGYCYEVKENFTNALESLDNSIKYGTGTSYEGIIYRNMARIYEEMNNPTKALEYYKKALKQTTDPSMGKLIERKIAILG